MKKRPNMKRPEKPFSVFRFAVTIVATLATIALATSLVAPDFWKATLTTPLWKFCVVFLLAHLFCGFAEFPFHRYILHSPFPFLGRLHRQHTLHHSLTIVKLISVQDDRGRIFNRYPIVEERQHEASYFPWYSLAGFVVAFLPIIVPLQVVMPEWPITAGSVLAIAWSISLYEMIHMAEHLSFEKFWKPKVTHPRFGKLWTVVYCFHLRHHADISSNENISGFFGFPIADVVFGTFAPWPKVFRDREVVPCSEFDFWPPRPRFFIRVLDKMTRKSLIKTTFQ